MGDDSDKTTLSQDTLQRAKDAGGPRASLVLYHRERVKVIPLADGSGLVIGRAWPSDVVLDDPSLSRQHARLTRVEEGVKVRDLGSTNGTHVAGERIDEVLLGPGETVTSAASRSEAHPISHSSARPAGVSNLDARGRDSGRVFLTWSGRRRVLE